MQIKTVELNHFLKHKHLLLNFEAGMNIMRAANEGGKCLTGDTLIHTHKGLVRIDSLDQNFTEGFTPIAEVVFSGQGPEVVSHFFKSTNQPVLRVRTKHGYILTGTYTHPLLTYNKLTAKHEYKPLSELKQGDFLCIDRRVQAFPPQNPEITFSSYSDYHGAQTKPCSVTTVTPELASVCGYLVANGSGSGGNLNFSSLNPALQNDFVEALGHLGVHGSRMANGRGVRVCHTNFKLLIEHLCGGNKFPTARYKTVPSLILQSNKETQRSFLRALLDCDGHQGNKGFEWVTASKNLSSVVKAMLLNFGVVSSTRIKRVRGYDHDYHRTHITGRDLETLWNEILSDSLRYEDRPSYYNSKNDVIPGLLDFIRRALKPKYTNGIGSSINLSSGAREPNKIFSGTTGQPQANMQVERLSKIHANVLGMNRDEELDLLLSRLSTIKDFGFFYSEVESVDAKGVADVYDITVPGSHSFVANGIVSHNSSCIEGIDYALRGAGALAKSVEDTVNWQAPSKAAMKVKLTFEHRGLTYVVKRGASGAEVQDEAGNVLCTGHKPVTGFIETLLGLAQGRSSQIMIANQNDIRGVISVGPTAAGEMIETMAGFSEIDELIKRILGDLPGGDTKPLEEQLLTMEQTMANIVVPEAIDLSEDLKVLDKSIEANKVLLKSSRDDLTKATVIESRNQDLLARKEAAQTRLLSKISGEAHAIASAEESARLQAELDKLLATKQDDTLYQEYQAVMAVDYYIKSSKVPEWEGTKESMDLEFQAMNEKINQLSKEEADFKAQIKAQLANKITATTCPTCGQNVGDPAEAARINAGIDVVVTNLRAKLASCQASLAPLIQDAQEIRQVKAVQTKIEQTLPASGLLVVDKNFVPWHVSSSREVPPPPAYDLARQKQLEKQIRGLAASTSVAVAQEQLRAARAEMDELEVQVQNLEEVELGPLRAEIAQLEQTRTQQLAYRAELVAAVQKNASSIAEANVMINSWAGMIAETKAKIKVMQENNAFIKALRAARLAVSDKLWTIVLSSLSNYFSRFRGVESIITRSGNTFLVDGRAGRPSGSTLDILGLSLRIVMAKVFANTGLLILDEPTSGCDAGRTGNVAGVLSGCGFDQIVWVSHSDIAELGMDANVVEL